MEECFQSLMSKLKKKHFNCWYRLVEIIMILQKLKGRVCSGSDRKSHLRTHVQVDRTKDKQVVGSKQTTGHIIYRHS